MRKPYDTYLCRSTDYSDGFKNIYTVALPALGLEMDLCRQRVEMAKGCFLIPVLLPEPKSRWGQFMAWLIRKVQITHSPY